jgi:hypothetical protein
MKQVKLTEIQKENIGMLYYCVKNGLEISGSLMEDKSLDNYIRYNFIRIWQTLFQKMKTRMDDSLGCNERFSDQIKNTDTIGLHDVITGYIAMSPEGREAVEELFNALKKNETIQVEVKEI